MIRDKFNQIINTLKGSSKVSQIEKEIDKLYSRTASVPEFKRNWVELMKSMMGDSSNQYVEEITNPLLSQSIYPDNQRIARYDSMRNIARKIPIVGKSLRLIVANILSPDDITKTSLSVAIKPSETEDAELVAIKNDFENIIEKFKLSSISREILFDTLLEGDRFVEILPIKFDEFIKKNDSAIIRDSVEINTKHDKISIDFNFYDTTVKPEEILLKEQIEGPMNFYDYIREVTGDNEGINLDDIILTIHDPRRVVALQNEHGLLLGYLVFKATKTTPMMYNMRAFMQNASMQSNTTQNIINDIIANIEQRLYGIIQNKFGDIEIPDELHKILYTILRDYKDKTKSINVRFVPPDLMHHFKYPSSQFKPYGEPYLMDLHFILSLLLTRVISSTIYKVARSGKHLVFYVESSNARDAARRIQKIKEQTKRLKVTSSDIMSVETIPSLISTFDDFYIPTIDGKRLVEIDTLDFSDAVKDRDDMDNMILKYILTGIDIPPPFLGIEENVNAKATLTQESMVFARTIVDLQRVFSEQLTELIQKIYFATHSKINPRYTDVYIQFPPPVGAISETFANMYQQISNIKDVLTGFNVPLDYIKHRFLPDIDWDKIEIEELKKSAQPKNEETTSAPEEVPELPGTEGA